MEKFSLKRVGPIVNLLVLVLQLVGFSILESGCCRALSVLKRGANLINFAMPKSGKSWRVSLSNFLSAGNRFAFGIWQLRDNLACGRSRMANLLYGKGIKFGAAAKIPFPPWNIFMVDMFCGKLKILSLC